jgi:hypothetical protein
MKHLTIIGLITLLAAFPVGATAQYERNDAISFPLNFSEGSGNGALFRPGQTQSPFSVFGFEPLAVKRVGLLSGDAKEGAVDEVIDALVVTIAEPGTGMETAIGTNGVDRLTYHEDDDTDGVSDEIGKMLEVHFTGGVLSDERLLRVSGRHHIVAMPLGIVGVLTHDEGDETEIQVYAAQPETYVRVFWRDLEKRKILEALAAAQGNRLDSLVQETLETHGFSACGDGGDCSNMSKGPLLPDPMIKVMEGMARFLVRDPSYSLSDYDHVAPQSTLGGTSIEGIVEVIETAIAGGTRGDIGESELADAFMAATAGDFEALNAILARAPDEIWGENKTLVDWILLRSLWFNPDVVFVEACQPFYATTALGAPTFNHFLALPCGYGVWQERKAVKMSVLNPMAVFSTLFNDGMIEVCLSTDSQDINLCRLFMKFPMIVFNDVASVMNGVLEQLGAEERIPLYEISEFREL